MDGLMEKSLKPFLGGTTAIESDSRTNKVLVITKKDNWPMILEIFEELDAEVKLKTTHKLFKLQHGDAEDVHRILQEIITGQQKVATLLQSLYHPRLTVCLLRCLEKLQIVRLIQT